MKRAIPSRNRQIFPVQNLPEELLLHIFSVGIAHNSFKSALPFLVAVTATCSHWRKLALETRGLWTNIVFEQLPTSRHSKEHSLSVLRLFLERSRDAPINLTISYNTSVEVDLNPVLIRHWPRVRMLSIRTVGPPPCFRPPYFLLTSLESMRYHNGTFELFGHDEVVANLSDGPFHLERLSLTGRRADNMLLLSLVPSSIRFLKIQGPRYTNRVLSFIGACSTLETLYLATSIELRSIVCASLTNLKLIGPVALTSLGVDIEAPNLRHLSLRCAFTDDNISLQFQQSTSRAIFPSLRTLTVVRPNIAVVHPLIVSLIQSNPSIIAMHLGDMHNHSPANTLRGVVGHHSTSPAPPPGAFESLEPRPSAHAYLSITLQDATLTPDDVPNLQFLRIEIGSHLFRDLRGVEDMSSVTERLLLTRDKLRIEWYCNDLGDDDPASAPWLASKLPKEATELRDGPLGSRFSINLTTHPTSLENLYPMDGMGVASPRSSAPLDSWLSEDEEW